MNKEQIEQKAKEFLKDIEEIIENNVSIEYDRNEFTGNDYPYVDGFSGAAIGIKEYLEEMCYSLAKQEQGEEWIRVGDDFPKMPGEYMCYSEDGYTSVEKVSKRDIENKMIYCDATDSGHATHWRPIPKPPKK